MQTSWPARILYWTLALGLGVLFGAAGTITHAITIGGFPLGLVLAIIAVGALLLALRCLFPGRTTTVICGVAMLGVTTMLSGVGPGGSVVVPNTPLAQVWLIALAAIVLVAVTWPELTRAGSAKPATNLE